MSPIASALVALRFTVVALVIAACGGHRAPNRPAPMERTGDQHEAERFEQHCDQLAARLRHAVGEYRGASGARKADVAKLMLMITGPTLYACGAGTGTLAAITRCFAQHSDCIAERTEQAAKDIASRTFRARWSMERGAAAHREHCENGDGWATEAVQALSTGVGDRAQTATGLIRSTYNTCSEERVPVGQLDRCYVNGDYDCVLRFAAQWQRRNRVTSR